MKVLLTGNRGFIGSHLLVALQERNYDVETYEWNDDSLPSIMDKDWVIHVGAISSTVERDVEKVLKQNYDFTKYLYDSCKTYGVNFQFASSASVYGLNREFKEDSPLDPRTPYAWSKYLSERHIQKTMGGNVTQIFRYFNVYGPDGEEHKGTQASPHFQFAKQAKEHGVIRLFKNSENYHRDFIHVSEIVDYHLAFMQKNVSGVFNLGTGTTESFLNVAEKFQVPIKEVSMPEVLKYSYQEYTCADMSKTKSVLKKNI